VFDQANWYAFGRLAWNPDADPAAIARQWLAITFTPDPRFVVPAAAMMLASREAAVDYMTPLGLAHQMATGHHYGPAPWVNNLPRPDWNPTYYARADAAGLGFDRTATGSNALADYAPEAAAALAADPRYLLWFHHVGWDDRLADGTTLWEALVAHYDDGVARVAAMQAQWARLASFVDAERFAKTRTFLAIQRDEAQWWRDASIAYWQSVNHRTLPAGTAPPAHPLDWYRALSFPHAPGQ
jgi:alpha-glucuronidase